jgi:hypothetical protein
LPFLEYLNFNAKIYRNGSLNMLHSNGSYLFLFSLWLVRNFIMQLHIRK